MTPAEMAEALRAVGWTVEPPITQETCSHPPHMVMGSMSMGHDGAGHHEWTCRRCGKHQRTEYQPTRAMSPLDYLLWN